MSTLPWSPLVRPFMIRSDQFFMQEALQLACKSPGLPYPNPWVGCVVVQNGEIVGRGFHRGAGTSHAEIEALAEAGRRARRASLYVNLEPCCHYGRTPPCTEAIVAAGIRRVVYAIRDPNPLVAGKSAAALKRSGLQVTRGVCAKAAAKVNEVYLKFRATGLPFVTVKVAASLDGKTATRSGESQWITGELARWRGRKLRAQSQAVLVGINTVLRDNPDLGPRIAGALGPWRVILDSSLRLPLRSRVLQTGLSIVACSRLASARKQRQLEARNAQVWRFRGQTVPITPLLRKLADHGIISLLVEGGSQTLGSFFDRDMVDRVVWYIAPLVMGSQRSLSAIGGAGIKALSDAWRLQNGVCLPVGECWEVRGNLSRWALG